MYVLPLVALFHGANSSRAEKNKMKCSGMITFYIMYIIFGTPSTIIDKRDSSKISEFYVFFIVSPVNVISSTVWRVSGMRCLCPVKLARLAPGQHICTPNCDAADMLLIPGAWSESLVSSAVSPRDGFD